ncbi:MAG: trigger factor [Candidatus Omnitrophica bacterium]|nr:trigger factor [Candidatus Omnitrophota bacterium]
MKTEVKKLEGGKVEINIEVSGEIVKNKFDEVFKKIGQEAKVPGFRPGHVPQDMLEKKFLGHANEQVLKELVPELYDQAVKNESISVIDMPNITDVKLERESLVFKATVEVMPEINVKKYKGIKIEYKKSAVSADDIKRYLDSLKESHKVDAVDDNFARSLGYPSLAELESTIEKQLFLQKQNEQRQKIETGLIDSVLKDLDFKIPETLVSRQLEDLLRQTKIDFAMKGIPREKIEKEEDNLRKNLEPEARRQVQVYLVLAEIAKKENIANDDHMPHHVIELLFKEADWKVLEG